MIDAHVEWLIRLVFQAHVSVARPQANDRQDSATNQLVQVIVCRQVEQGQLRHDDLYSHTVAIERFTENA